jgi:hypothetical protein
VGRLAGDILVVHSDDRRRPPNDASRNLRKIREFLATILKNDCFEPEEKRLARNARRLVRAIELLADPDEVGDIITLSMALGVCLQELHYEPAKHSQRSWRQRGGKATRKISEEHEDRVLEIYREE